MLKLPNTYLYTITTIIILSIMQILFELITNSFR